MTLQMLAFTVRGIPAPQGSKNAYVNRHTGRPAMVESSERVRPWRYDVASAASDATAEWSTANGAWWTPLTGPVTLRLTFRFARPKSHYGTGRNSHLLKDSAPGEPTTKNHGDVDKLVRAIMDAFTTAGVWDDDAQVTDLHAVKVWADGELGLLAGVAVTINGYQVAS